MTFTTQLRHQKERSVRIHAALTHVHVLRSMPAHALLVAGVKSRFTSAAPVRPPHKMFIKKHVMRHSHCRPQCTSTPFEAGPNLYFWEQFC